ncbi:MAG TPA: hypothetical protein VI136_06535 [Verrucomicrobiae bacterium]
MITPEEQPRWDDLITTRHYLKNATLVGERLCYVVTNAQDQRLALLGWSTAAYHLNLQTAVGAWMAHPVGEGKSNCSAVETRLCKLWDLNSFRQDAPS